jgi:hypothetical protein
MKKKRILAGAGAACIGTYALVDDVLFSMVSFCVHFFVENSGNMKKQTPFLRNSFGLHLV